MPLCSLMVIPSGRSFPIPMRGNEIREAADNLQIEAVPDPHEG